MSRLEKYISTLVFVSVLVTFAYFYQGGGPNPNSRFNLVRAMVEDGTLSIDNYHTNTFDKSSREGHYYSDKAPGLSFAAVPIYAVFRLLQGPISNPNDTDIALYLITIFSVGLFSALSAVAFYLLLRRFGISSLAALLALSAWLIGSSAFAYGIIFLAHQFVGSLLLLAFALLYWRSNSEALSDRGRLCLVSLAGLLAGWASISEYPAGIVAGFFFIYGTLRLGIRAMVPFAIAGLVPLVILGGYNQVCFGSPFSLGYSHLTAKVFQKVANRGFFGLGMPDPQVMVGILVDEYRGLLPLSPILALAPLGYYFQFKKRRLKLEAGVMLAAVIFHWLLVSSYVRWDGGLAIGPRYFVPALPFLSIPLAYVFELPRVVSSAFSDTIRVIAVILLVVSVSICTVCVLVMPEFPDFPPGVQSDQETKDIIHHPIGRFIMPMFLKDMVSQKTVRPNGTVDLAFLDPDGKNDTWNIGEKMGLRGRKSIIPLLVFWALAAGIAFQLNRRYRADS